MESFLDIVEERNSKGQICVSPYFNTNGRDLMLKGGEFYAIYNSETGMWSTDEEAVIHYVDNEIIKRYQEDKAKNEEAMYVPILMSKSKTHKLGEFKTWKSQLPKDWHYIPLDSCITLDDEVVTFKEYRSKRLPYHIAKGPHKAYDKFMDTCYSPEERSKLEWAIGAIFTGDSKKLQKFMLQLIY